MKLLIPSALLTAALGMVSTSAPALAQPLPGLLDFFEIATPTEKTPRIDNYDETWMITGPVSEFSAKATEGPNWQLLEGQIVYAYYRFAEGDSALQIQRALEAAATEQGYEIAFACTVEKGDCFDNGAKGAGVSIGLLLDSPKNMPTLDAQNMDLVRNYFMNGGARLFYLVKDEGDLITHMQIALADTPDKGVMAITKSVIIGEAPALNAAATMRDKLVAGESVMLDNLLFDVDSAILLPSSRDQLFEIAMMLRDDPALNLQIIGHTDSDGGRAHNQDLSERRAAAVVDALANGFDIELSRLTSSGRGMDEPIASNDTSEGKAQNRRVELKLR